VTDSPEVYGEIRLIRARLDGIEHMTEVLVRAQHKEILPEIMAALQNDDLLRRIYLLVDGKRTQQEVGMALEEQGVSGDKTTVSRRLEKLYKELHLLELVDQTGRGKVYIKSRLDQTLGITRRLERQRPADGRREDNQPTGG
jgi:transcriptional regulator of acetoin/glycerol metabolism